MSTRFAYALAGGLSIAWIAMVAFPSPRSYAAGSSAGTEDSSDADFGKPVNGLRIKLKFDEKVAIASDSTCEFVIQNVGESSLNLQLGVMLGNGESHHPTSLQLVVHENEKATSLVYSQPRIAGRMDPFVISLPQGSSYTLRCPLNSFVHAESGRQYDFADHRYELNAALVAKPVIDANPDMSGLKLMRFWQGTVQSNRVAAVVRSSNFSEVRKK